MLGNSVASWRISSENRNPTPNTSWLPAAASWRSAASRSLPSPVSRVWTSTPSPVRARSRPAQAASLNDLSPRPPTSNTRPTLRRVGVPREAWSGACEAGGSARFPHPAARTATAARASAARMIGRCGISSSGWCGVMTGAAAQLVAAAAARLVEIGAADQHAPAAAHLAVGAVGGATAHHADGEGLGDVLRDGEQVRHGLERPPRVVLVEPGHDHALAAARQALAHPHQVGTEELALVDADDLGVAPVVEDLARVADRVRGDAQLAVRDDVVAGVAVVDHRLEDLDALARDLGASQAADQLLGLAAVHAADDD